MQIIPRRNVCRTFDIERYYVLVIQTEFYTPIFCCICQRETRTANYASNFESQGLIWPDVLVSIDLVAFRTFLWTVLPGLFSFLRTAFNKVDPPRSRFRGDGPSFNGWWFGPRRQWNLKLWSHINRCPRNAIVVYGFVVQSQIHDTARY